MARRSQLVCQQLERIPSEVFEKYQSMIKQYVGRRNGVYALYKREKLYYLGLATNLRRRLKRHLRDRHRGLWDRFSVYLTIGEHHIRELEALLLRIIRPAGNKQIGRFVKCENLNKLLARDIKAQIHDEVNAWSGKRPRAGGKRDSDDRRPVLAPYLSLLRRKRLRGRRKQVTAKAHVARDGSIIVAGMKGRKFKSPSFAAREVLGFNANGWSFWRYERSPGEWVNLTHLRD